MLSYNLVSNVMNTDIIPVKSDDTLHQVSAIFKRMRVRHLPVMKGNEVIGMVGKSDIERVVAAYTYCVENANISPTALESVPVSEIMSQKIVHIQSNQTIEEAAEILRERAFRALPVLNGNELVGVISTTSLMEYVVDEMNANGVYI